MTLVLILAAAAAPLADPACAARHIEQPATATVQGATLPYVRCGRGAPTIVFEGGFGGNLQNWAKLLPMVGQFAPVFAYSRPGFRGTSGEWAADADGVRTSEESARLLRELLKSAKVEPPFLLVGHSLGGLYIQKFAQLYPAETAGLVLMDNRPATLMKRCEAQGLPECKSDPPPTGWSAALRRTYLGIAPSEAVAPTAAQLGDTPILLITAGSPEDGVGKAFFHEFKAAQTAFAAQLKHGRQKTIAPATHSSLSDEQASETASEIRQFWQSISKQR